jgi:hypothetical protein
MHIKILKWAERIVRTFDNRIQKRIVEGSFGGRSAGRPRNGWEDEVSKDVILLNTKKTGSQLKNTGVTGGRKTWRPLPGNGRKCHTK